MSARNIVLATVLVMTGTLPARAASEADFKAANAAAEAVALSNSPASADFFAAASVAAVVVH